MFISRRLLLISKIPSPFAKNRKKEARFRPQPRQMRNKLHYYGDNGNTEGEDESSVDEDDSSLPGGGYMRKRKASVFMLGFSDEGESSIEGYIAVPDNTESEGESSVDESLTGGYMVLPDNTESEDESSVAENDNSLPSGGYVRKKKANVFMLSSSSGDESSIKDYMPPPYLRHSSLSEGLKRPLMHRTEDEDVTSENYHRIDMGPNLS